MMDYNLVLSPRSLDDLKDTHQYGVLNWGAAQASDYLNTLKACFWKLTEQPEMGVEREELLPNMRSFSIENHIIFYRLQSRHIEIVRVLHARQDPQRQIK
jgi:toxin ParE1/3/4